MQPFFILIYQFTFPISSFNLSSHVDRVEIANVVPVHRDLGEGSVGRGGGVVVRIEIVWIVSMVCWVNLWHVAKLRYGRHPELI